MFVLRKTLHINLLTMHLVKMLFFNWVKILRFTNNKNCDDIQIIAKVEILSSTTNKIELYITLLHGHKCQFDLKLLA